MKKYDELIRVAQREDVRISCIQANKSEDCEEWFVVNEKGYYDSYMSEGDLEMEYDKKYKVHLPDGLENTDVKSTE